MFTGYVAVTAVAVIANLYAAAVDLVRADWILANMDRYGVPRSWLIPLGVAKAAGAAGLLVGYVMPAIGVAAGIALTAFFGGAIATVLLAGARDHLVYPVAYLALSVAALVLRLVSA